MKEDRATYFCIDIECSGTVPGLFDMVSLGAQAVSADARGELRLGETFYVEIRPTGAGVDPSAMAIHGLTLAHLAAHGVSRRAALEALTRWVEARTVPGTEPVFVGHNAPFDWSFVSYAFKAEELPNPFGYKALDTKALSAGVLGLHWFDTDKGTLSRLLQLPPEDRTQKHRADYDAEYQARILLALLARIPDRVG
jgi:DNA polymerase III alpha subunit (gram-positive type)